MTTFKFSKHVIQEMRWHSATDMHLRTLRFWQGGGIIFKNGVPKSSKLVLKYMLEAK